MGHPLDKQAASYDGLLRTVLQFRSVPEANSNVVD